MTDQILPNEILREIVHNCPQGERLKIAMAFRGASKSFGDILGLSGTRYLLDSEKKAVVCEIIANNEPIGGLAVLDAGIGFQFSEILNYTGIILLRAENVGIIFNSDVIISQFHHGQFELTNVSDSFREYITTYDHTIDTYPDRKHPMGLAQKIFWKTCKYYIPPVIVQFIYDQVQLMERQLRGH